MYQYHLIQLNGTYITSNGLVGGDRYISEITGLGPLQRPRQSITILPLEGAPIRQFGRNEGLPISIFFPLEDVTTFGSFITACNNSDNAGTNISLYISGPTGTYNLDVVCTDIEINPNADLQAGITGVKFSFAIADFRNILTAVPGSITLTGSAASLNYSA